MKKTALIAALTLLCGTTAAEAQNYRQNLDKEISTLIVRGDCIVHLKLDSVNWIMYRSDEGTPSLPLVSITGNTVETTPEANGKEIHIATSAGYKIPGKAVFNIDVTDAGRVIFRGDTLQKGHYEQVLYSGKVENSKTGRKTEYAVIYQSDDKKSVDTTRDWTGMRKYTFGDRFHNHFHWGWSLFLNNASSSLNTLAVKSSFATNISWQFDYSLYMDDHIGAGFGIEYGINNYGFSSPIVTGRLEGDNYYLGAGTSDLPGKWETSANELHLGIPFHIAFFPYAKKHYFNFRLDLIPRITIWGTQIQQYQYATDDVIEERKYERAIPFNLFNLTARFSTRISLLGFYAEANLLPIFKGVKLNDGTDYNPFHFAAGIVIDLSKQ